MCQLLVTYTGCTVEPTRTTEQHWRAHDWPVLGSSIAFFARRRDMLLEGRDASAFPGGHFSFFVGSKHVVALSGVEGRQTFFENRGLSLAQGFVELLTGKLPSATNEPDYGLNRLIKPLLAVTTSNELSRRLPRICKDVDGFTKDLRTRPAVNGSVESPGWRVTNIFMTAPLLVYKLMHRTVGITELCDKPKLLLATFEIYRRFEKYTSKAHIVFPWLITPSHAWRLILAARLYRHFDKVISRRKKEGRREDDAVQLLIDKGESNPDVIEFVFVTFVGGLTTTSFTSSWMLLLLAQNPSWKELCRREVDRAVAKYRTSSSQTPNQVLQCLSLQQWESEAFPIISACLKETLRTHLPGAMLRRNATGRDIPIGASGQMIPAGSYAAYSVADTHLNAELYPDPNTFNPGRHLGSRLELKPPPGSHTYLGWGSGRHVCVGMRMAKLMVFIITAHMLANFDFELSDPDGGENTAGLPPWSTNAIRMEISDAPAYLRYKVREEAAGVIE
ncbi:Cytochrome P450 [Rhypophila decipiens]